MAHTDYAEIPSGISSIGEYMSFRRSHAKARVTPGSIIESDTTEEFEERVEWAENEKLRKETQSQDKQYWISDDTTAAEIIVPIAEVRKNEQLIFYLSVKNDFIGTSAFVNPLSNKP